MSSKVNDYEKLLQDLSTRLGDEDAGAIRSVLEKVQSPAPLISSHFFSFRTFELGFSF